MKFSPLLIGFVLLWQNLVAAPPLPERNYFIAASPSHQQLDSLSIIAESFAINDPEGNPLDRAFYEIDFIRASIQLRLPEFWQNDSLEVRYRVWPVNFASPVFVRDTSLIRLPGPGEDPLTVAVSPTFPEQGLLRFEGLQSSGSITRGLTMGNRQDATLNSSMNLQLSGKLTDDIEILAVISDQNIPFQPEGTTQQIQDFDRVFIQLSGAGATLTAGDFEIERPHGHFMNINRKARGASFAWESPAEDSLLPGGGAVHTLTAAAISRGKYARNAIAGMEGNQGPYRLRGNDNENFIIVMAGTERVFVDGVLLTRGTENDYIIDYNMAEITFMPSRTITRDSRIVVEFEYAERNYARSMVYTANQLDYERGSFRFNFFSEQDHRNQPLFQDISDERKTLMAAVGDSIHRAFDWNLDSTGFKNDRVMYRLTDTLGFDTVFVYSTDPQHAVYQLGFTYVGEGNGNYRQATTAANGRVYQWVAPINGVPQGSHEPIILLVTPKKHQMLTLGGDITLARNTTLLAEYAFTNRDINLFSDLHKENNIGHALQLGMKNTFKGRPEQDTTWTFTTELHYEVTDQNFSAPERYREVEFERDWNLEGFTTRSSEHLPGFSFTAQHPQLGRAQYSLQAILSDDYDAFRNRIDSRLQVGRNLLEYNGSLLASSGLRDSRFYRHRAVYTRDLGLLQAGVGHWIENNRIEQRESDDLSLSSFYFEEAEAFISNPEASVNTYRIFYRQRRDHLPQAGSFQYASLAHNYGINYQHRQNPSHRYGLQLSYRELEVFHERFPGEQNDKTLNGRIDHFLRMASGAVTSNVFYEAASAMERKREYMYVEVPHGQGVYIWNDYNGNGIMELDEFEIAPYPDEANFIRVFVPTDDFIRTYRTAISHSITLEPATLWREEDGWKGLASRFSNRLNYRIDKKNQGGAVAENFNPFFTSVEDTLLITLSASVRNSLFFNRTHRVYGLEWTVQESSNKSILSNGFESRVVRSQQWRARWNISTRFSFFNNLEYGHRRNESEFFSRRNYHIRYYENEPSLSYQPAPHLRVRFFYGYNHQENTAGETGEKARIHKTGLETRANFPGRGNLQVRYQISEIDYPFAENTPVAFEILQALRPGTNHIWNINWQHNLSAYLQLNLSYHGRKPPSVQAIHTGSVQLRAFF